MNKTVIAANYFEMYFKRLWRTSTDCTHVEKVEDLSAFVKSTHSKVTQEQCYLSNHMSTLSSVLCWENVPTPLYSVWGA